MATRPTRYQINQTALTTDCRDENRKLERSCLYPCNPWLKRLGAIASDLFQPARIPRDQQQLKLNCDLVFVFRL